VPTTNDVVVDEPTSSPEWARVGPSGPEWHEVELCVVNDDGVSEAERHRVHASIARGIRDGRAGREMDLDSFMDQLDAEP
jgi:hypothetical protein